MGLFGKGWSDIGWEVSKETVKWVIGKVMAGGGFLASFFAAFSGVLGQPVSWQAIIVIFFVSCLCLAIGFVKFSPKRNGVETPEGGREDKRASFSVYFFMVLSLVGCVGGYIVIKKVLQLSADLDLVQKRMERYVLPRTLTEKQKVDIASYLSQHKEDAHPVVMKVIPRNEEAGSFRADLQEALEKGGWPISDVIYDDTIPEGLRIHIQEPRQEPEPTDPFDRLKPPKMNPSEILGEAFKQAGVIVHGSGSGGGVNITTTTVTIFVGSRRRDKGAIPYRVRQLEKNVYQEDPDKVD